MRSCVALTILALTACESQPSDPASALARTYLDAVAQGNEAAFIKLHLMSGDMDTQHKGYFTIPSGIKPDGAWEESVRAKFWEVRRWLQSRPGKAVYVGLVKPVSPQGEWGDLNSFCFEFKIGDARFYGRIARSRQTHRGRAITGEPGLRVYTNDEIHKAPPNAFDPQW